ncbi:glycerol-3-phosphate responsive antiterminator [Oceanobacillus iheyensis]|uniref:Glycerol uptake operon antiterminator regulatory protein n=1 Tax=Oceanobacillus iheyensis (strain DSM 14371 / CIP 107618 / JCM 11309 / KCTC 3954 / HTE831) TaxID=221109 RepID=Q8ENK5_OCEIH|nr:glycerol-3-phosphate responsive antiterminator [Oceanobacillus iheyensis]BAC14433.1 transcriptional antiterminator of glycerol uptake operon [Oceanobacillus iheyensis HTE831]
MELPTGVLPAVRQMKDFDKALETDHEYIVILESRLVQLKSLIDYSHRNKKKVLVHFDLIQGLKADEYGMEFLNREMKPDGVLSTRGNVIALAKKYKLLAIQRIFLLDSLALDQNMKLVRKFQPHCIELLPGLMPDIIQQVGSQTNIPIIAGGLIRKDEEVNYALEAGAIAVSTSNTTLWK